MEQKLADFRARRKADMVKKEECTEKQHIPQPDDTFQATRDSTTDQKNDVDLPGGENPLPVTQKSYIGRMGEPDWLLDSSLGRWLGSKHLAFTNLTLLKVLLWLVLLGLFVELDFGLPFFLISLFYWMYEGLRSPSVRQPGELSAYSVFNPDCQPLLGAVTAEQLEREMGYRPLTNR